MIRRNAGTRLAVTGPMPNRLRGLRPIVLFLALVACTPPAPAPSASSPSSPGAVEASNIRLSCGGGPSFTADALSGPLGAETADDPMAAALRVHLATREMDIDLLPDEGYRLVARTERAALFLSETDRLDSGYAQVSLELREAGWRVTGWGDCRPQVAFEGVNGANWELDGALSPDGRQFQALVTERECASGQSSEGRVLPPVILYQATQVVVIFAVRPRPGDVQTCPGNPATPVRVELAEPLGDRELLDGGTFPPVPPTDPYSRT